MIKISTSINLVVSGSCQSW